MEQTWKDVVDLPKSMCSSVKTLMLELMPLL